MPVKFCPLGAILLAFMSMSSLQGQTIHGDDLPYFVGKYRVSIVPSEKGRPDRVIDCSHFVEWKIVAPDNVKTKRRSGLQDIVPSQDGLWIYNPSTDPERIKSIHASYRTTKPKLLNLRFCVMIDYFGHELQRNVLTVWEPVGRDSLRYLCGQVGLFNSSIGSAWISKVTVFPDSSILMIVETRGGGDGSRYGKNSFLRAEDPCSFELFYQTDWMERWPGDKSEYSFYDFEHIYPLSYQVVEVREYLTIDRLPNYDVHMNIDSATVNTIDLWELAKEYFQIVE